MIASTDWMSQHRHREIFYDVGGSFVAELLCQYFSIWPGCPGPGTSVEAQQD